MQNPSVALQSSFDWNGYLQQWLTNPAVVVSRLHPVFGRRLAAFFIDLDNRGIAGRRIKILSGVRTRAHQNQLYEADKRRNGGRPSGYVANPNTIHGMDAEGVQRAGSNHMAQRVQWGEELGYAVDLWNRDGSSAAAYRDIHPLLSKYGLDWPLKSGVVERWHIEWFPRSARGPLDGPVAWPEDPGVTRPIMRGMLGGDVKDLQEILGVKADGVAGPVTEAAWRKRQASLGRPQTNRWSKDDYLAYKNKPAKEVIIVPPEPDPKPDPVPIKLPQLPLFAAELEIANKKVLEAADDITKLIAKMRAAS